MARSAMPRLGLLGVPQGHTRPTGNVGDAGAGLSISAMLWGAILKRRAAGMLF